MTFSSHEIIPLENLFAEGNLDADDDDGALSDDDPGAFGGNSEARRTDNYAWEAGYSASWTKRPGQLSAGKCLIFTVKDKLGRLEEVKQLVVDADRRVRRPYMDVFKYQPDQYLQNRVGRKSTIRSLVIIVDSSESMKEPDLKPNRIGCVQSILLEFFPEFFKNGPISQLALLAVTNKDATLLSSLTSSVSALSAAFNDSQTTDLERSTGGDPSVQAALERSIRLLQGSPSHSAKEILLIYGSCLTNDAGDIQKTIKYLKDNHLRVSVVSLSPELFILKKLSTETGGDFVVCLNRTHLKEAIFSYAEPKAAPQPTLTGDRISTLIDMGFPSIASMSTVSLCVCHNQLGFDGYCCPRCQMRSCSLPTTCKACDLALVSAVDVARCQALDATPPPFIPLPAGDGICFVCARKFVNGGGQCPACHGFVCFNCDILIHTSLNFCPNCHKNEIFLRQGFPIDPKPPLILPPTTFPDAQFLATVAQVESSYRHIVLENRVNSR